MDDQKPKKSLLSQGRGMYDKALKRKPDGSFERWLGVRKDGGTKQVFRMPAQISQEEAEWRWKQIEALWDQIESEVVSPLQKFGSVDDPLSVAWDEERLSAAKAIARGEKKPSMDRRLGEFSVNYVK